MPYRRLSQLVASWPGLDRRLVRIGGVSVTCADAVTAAEILQASRTSAIAPVLRAAGSLLAPCDYFAAAAPYLAAARSEPKTGRAGAAGRHVTKNAFLAAVTAAVLDAREAELSAVLSEFATDERYVTAMAREAVVIRERAHVTGMRTVVRSVVTRAVVSCRAVAGQFTCSAVTACGTGSCRFSDPPYRGVTAVAGPGRLLRPANHVKAGEGFTEAGAAAQLATSVPFSCGVPVWDADGVRGQDQAA
jgi:hypothetical protein